MGQIYWYSTWCKAIYVDFDVIQQLWVWAEELHQTPNELKNNLYKAIYSEGNTTTHHTANTGNKELLQSLLGVTNI